MEYTLVVVATGVMMLASFYFGCKLTQRLMNKETITKSDVGINLPKFKEKVDIEKENLDILMDNIENYDGYGGGQKDFK